METIDENLKHIKEAVSETAACAFGAFTNVCKSLSVMFRGLLIRQTGILRRYD